MAYPSIVIMGLFVFLAKTLGYLPGQHIGWGSPIARQQTLDWARWGYGGTFLGTDGRNLEPAIKNLDTQNLCVGFTDDKTLARPTSVQHFAEMLPDDKTTVWILSPEELDTPALGHFDHLRNGAKLWTKLDHWIKSQL
ncbi:MAG: hypothetical protein JKX94_12310 [Sneathiella sp.]|nr:hypothetical protein [Sneathiella sp.]